MKDYFIDYEPIYYNDEIIMLDSNGKTLFVEHNDGTIEYTDEDFDEDYR